MKKIIIVIIAVVVLGGLVYLMNQIAPTVTTNDLAIIKQAYLEGGSAECTFVEPAVGDWPQEEVSISIKDGKIKMFTQTPEMEANIIIKDGMAYVWDGEMGMKFTIEQEEIADIPLFAHMEDESAFDEVADHYEIDCKVARIDDSVFELPEGVEFQDLSEMMPMEQDMPEFDPEIEFDIEDFEDIDWDDLDINLEDLEIEIE